MKDHNMKDLGVFVSIFAEAGYLDHAQEYLNELQERLNAMQGMKKESTATRIVRQAREGELLLELPLVETQEPTLRHEPQVSSPLNEGINDEQAEEDGEQIAAEAGMIRDEAGKVTHVSVQAGNLGYDPEIHENTALKIYCDGKHIENAHTADTTKGVVRFYRKNEQGRIKTLTVYGVVEIRGV